MVPSLRLSHSSGVASASLSAPYRLSEQARSEYLVKHQTHNWFNLRPDIVIKDKNEPAFILDTKWKRIDSRLSDGRSKYNISQADMYQLFAYGQKYLNGKGEVFLVYPAHEHFQRPLAQFDYTENLHLWAIPYDLKTDCLLTPDNCEMHEIFNFTEISRAA